MAEQMVEDPSYRRVINTFAGTTNIVDIKTQIDSIVKALDMCESSLSKHCGPTSGYAMLVDAMSLGLEFNPNIFTRDGIGILSAIEFLSPLETYIKQLITYVGSRVDAVAKDGTTTSMLYTIGIIRHILQSHDNWRALKMTTKEIGLAIDEYLTKFFEELKTYSHTVESLFGEDLSEEKLMEAAGDIAFMQAMSSSGGNVDLATAMGKIFTGSPKVTWDQISYYNSIKENDRPFTVEVDEFDTHFRCIMNGDNVMNAALGTEYIAEDVDILCYPDAMMDYTLKSDEVSRYLKDAQDERPIAIVTTLASATLITTVRDLNTSRKNKISIWQYSPEEKFAGQNYPWELFIFCAIAGVRPYCMPDVSPDTPFGDDFIIHAKKIHYHDTFLDIHGIVDMPEGTCIHPYYLNRESAPSFYVEVLEQVEKKLESYRDGNQKDGTMYSLFLQMMNKLVSVHRPTLRLGGTTHEQMSNISVVQDVQGATMSSLNNGFLIAGPIILLAVLERLEKFVTEYEHESKQPCLLLFHEAMKAGVETAIKYLYPIEVMHVFKEIHPGAKWYWNILSGRTIFETPEIDDYLKHLEVFKASRRKHKEEDLVYPFQKLLYRDYPILHPLRVYQELIKRTREIVLKLALTNEIIVGGGVMMSEKDKQKHEETHGNNSTESA